VLEIGVKAVMGVGNLSFGTKIENSAKRPELSGISGSGLDLLLLNLSVLRAW
jgi:hypothetical protein